jgi:hypothetical protein
MPRFTSPFTDEVFCRPITYHPVLVDNRYTDTFVDINFKDGIKCPCMSNTKQIWQNIGGFRQHTKCGKHQIWLENLTKKAADMHVRCIEAEELAEQRAKINVRLENELVVYRMRCEMLERHIADMQSLANRLPNLKVSID